MRRRSDPKPEAAGEVGRSEVTVFTRANEERVVRGFGPGVLAMSLRILCGVLAGGAFVLLCLLGVLAVLAIAAYVGMSLDAPLLAVELDDPWYVVAPGFAIGAGALLVTLLVARRLQRVFATLEAGDPFVPENADHLAFIAAAISIFELTRYVLHLGSGLLIRMFDLDMTHSGRLPISAATWIAVLALVVLSEVFRQGAALRQEQKLTI